MERITTEGEWVLYPQGSDPFLLEEALRGKGTGWCTAEGEAPNQLKEGDFYVYFTLNSRGEPTEPRIAIRMEDENIAEIRGVDKMQELEPELVDIAKEKYKNLPGAEKYEQADHDMRIITAIYDKCFSIDSDSGEKEYLNPDLTKEEIRILYEIERPVESFGYDKDPRIAEIKESRNIKQDLAQLFDCTEDEISIGASEEEWFSNRAILYPIEEGARIHYGYAIVDGEKISGTLDTSIVLNGTIKFPSLVTATGLILNTRSELDISFEALQDFSTLDIPEGFEGKLRFIGVQEMSKVVIPRNFKGLLSMNDLKNANNIEISEGFTGALWVRGISDITKLPLLSNDFSGEIDLSGLSSIVGYNIPERTQWIGLDGITDIDNLVLSCGFQGEIKVSSKKMKLAKDHVENILKERYPLAKLDVW